MIIDETTIIPPSTANNDGSSRNKQTQWYNNLKMSIKLELGFFLVSIIFLARKKYVKKVDARIENLINAFSRVVILSEDFLTAGIH